MKVKAIMDAKIYEITTCPLGKSRPFNSNSKDPLCSLVEATQKSVRSFARIFRFALKTSQNTLYYYVSLSHVGASSLSSSSEEWVGQKGMISASLVDLEVIVVKKFDNLNYHGSERKILLEID